ncbi:MAG: AAA family ATPase [Pseudomonadota bacterium]|nr:AAA family ATPase [Pseudomonadota bacterium]
MYESYFGLKEKPFSIAPDPRYIYLSDAHEDALAHLLFGVQEGGGFALMTGEVGTGKTTLLRTLVQQLPENIDLALVFNPMLSPLQFVATVCDELKIPYDADKASLKLLIDALNKHLLAAYLDGRRTILVIDEAQSLSVEVLEQIRLLTNLETTREKLLQIILIGQPELRETLARTDMRQLAQRITDVFHLEPLSLEEVRNYLIHRLTIAGAQKSIFSDSAVRAIYAASGGVPRLVNELADKALLSAYAKEKRQVDRKMVREASKQVLASRNEASFGWLWGVTAAVVILAAAGIFYLWRQSAPVVSDPALQQPMTSGQERSSRTRVEAEAIIEPPVVQQAAADDTPVLISNGVSTPYLPEDVADQAIAQVTDSTVLPSAESKPAESASESKPLQVAAEIPLAAETGEAVVHPQEANAGQLIADREAAPGNESGGQAIADKGVDAEGEREEEQEKESSSDAITLDEWIYDHSEETSRENALKELVSVWKVDVDSNSDTCKAISEYGLRCLKMNGSWAMINEINRPVIVQLHMGNQRSHYVTLLGSDDESVVIRFNSEVYRFPHKELSARWFGEFELVWQEPPMGFRSTMLPGDRGEQIEWLRDRLREISGEDIPPEKSESFFDERLAEAVRSFQASNHLTPDAMVGTQTIIRLNSASPSDSGPRLKVSS